MTATEKNFRMSVYSPRGILKIGRSEYWVISESPESLYNLNCTGDYLFIVSEKKNVSGLMVSEHKLKYSLPKAIQALPYITDENGLNFYSIYGMPYKLLVSMASQFVIEILHQHLQILCYMDKKIGDVEKIGDIL